MGFGYRRDMSGIVVVTMDMDGQSANTMSPAYHEQMGATVARLESEKELTGVVFTSAKKTFFAGGDLHGLLKAEAGDEAYQAWLNEDKGFLRRLEKLPVPIVAAINGAALGGGLEICLACNHRIIVSDPRAIVGLPEVTLGLLPGAGGVSRLPRMLAIDDALDILLTGRAIGPDEALRLGLVDAVVSSAEHLLPEAITWILANPSAHRQPWDLDRIWLNPVQMDAARELIAQARVEVRRRTRNRLPAPQRILDIMESALDLDIDATLALETALFSSLLGLPETRAAISTNFFATNAIRSGKLRPPGGRFKAATLCVVGGSDEAVAIARDSKSRGLETHRADYGPVVPSSVVLGFQNAGQQGFLSEKLIELCESESIYGFHTSGASIERSIVSGQKQEQLFGFHVPAVPKGNRVVEIAGAPETSRDTICRAYDFFQQIGRTPIMVRGAPGYISRLVAAYIGEGLSLLADGMAPSAIENAADEAGMIMPPLLWLDEILDAGSCAPLLGASDFQQRVIHALAVVGRAGKSSGKGAYDYDEAGAATLWPGMAQFRERDEAIGLQEAIDRLLYIQAVETMACLHEGVISSTEEADVGSVMGFGFPAHTGGTVQYIRGIGAAAFMKRCGELAARWGDRFRPTADVSEILEPTTSVLAEG